jgi:hypothetical protein
MKNTNIFKKQASDRIGIDDLINYIKKNHQSISDINYVDLNNIGDTKIKKLEKLNFQDVRQITQLSEKLNILFDIENNKYLHAGVLEHIPNYGNNNISLYSSVLVCLNPSLLTQNTQSQQKFLTIFLDCLKLDSKNINYSKYKWQRDDIYNCISKGFVGINIIKFLCDYLCINIFVLDLEKEKLIFGGGEYYNPHRKHIFLIRYEGENFEPLYNEQSRFFSITSNIVKCIRNSKEDIEIFPLYNDMPIDFVEREENLDNYLNIKKNKNNDNIKNDEELNENKESKYKFKKNEQIGYKMKDLKPLKLNDLYQISEALLIDVKIGDKKKTKDQLMAEILEIQKK